MIKHAGGRKPVAGVGSLGFSQRYGIPEKVIRNIGVARFAGYNENMRQMLVSRWRKQESRSANSGSALRLPSCS